MPPPAAQFTPLTVEPVEPIDASGLESAVASPPDTVSLPNGLEWDVSSERGLGSLRIDNGTHQDAVAALFDVTNGEAKSAVRAIYVRKADKATLEGVRPGIYVLRFSLGDDWFEEERRFKRQSSWLEFEERFTFTEPETETGIEFHRFSVTLHGVLMGQARTEPIGPARFDLTGLVRVGQRER